MRDQTPLAPEPGGAGSTPAGATPAGATPPAWLVEALRRPIAVDPGRAARIMALVRQAPPPAPRPRGASVLPLPPRRPRWATRRGVLAPGGGAVLAAVLTLFLWVGRIGAPHGAEVPGAAAMSATVLRDTVLGDALRDTMRIVRLVLAAPGAAHVAAAGDFNRWDGAATPLHRDARTGTWSGTVVVPRDAVRLAFVIDGRWVPGPAVAPDDRRPRPAAPAPSFDSLGTGLPGDTI